MVPFDEEGVQAKIQAKMRSEQFRALREQVQQSLMKDAIVRSDDQMVGTAVDIATQAQREGVRDLRQSGLIKVRAGVTTLEEVISVTNE